MIHPPFRLYFDGSVYYDVSSIEVKAPLSFAHVCDLHLAPSRRSLRDARYRHAIGWCERLFRHPAKNLPRMLDEIAERGVDFVFFGGDTIDYFHPEPARRVVESCEKRGLTAFFQLGNHDSEDLHSRYVSHEYEPANRQNSTHDLCSLWKMERPYYSFCRKGVRFVVADTSRYHKTPVGYAAVIEDEQKDWILSELQRGEPTVVFHHVPFNLPGLEYRLRAVWGGILACIAEDRNGLELKHAIGESAHVLGIFSAHAHIRSANPLGATCQFLTGPAHDGKWRYVEFGNRAAPKALRVQGEPHVESVRGKGKQF